MNSLDLNFASTPFRNKTPYYLGYGLGAALLVAFTAYNTLAFFAYSESRDALASDYSAKKTRLERFYLDSTTMQEQVRKENIEAINARATFTNSLLEQRRFSWTDLLNSLEEVQPYGVRLLSLLPRIQEKGILIDARAASRDLEDFYNFQHNLLVDPRFRRVYPGGYTHSEESGEYLFNVQFNYFPGGAPPDVQGLSPEDLKLADAPGAGGGETGEGEDPSDEMPAEEAPPPPASRTANGGGAKNHGKQTKPVAGVIASQPPAPAVAPPKPAAGGPSPLQPGPVAGSPVATPSWTQPPIAGSPAPGAPGGPSVPYQGRGLMPGTAGARPAPPPRSDQPPRNPAPAPPQSSYDDNKKDDDSGDDDGGDDGADE